MRKPMWAVRFKIFCQDNGYSAQDIANILCLQRATIYKYWAGDIIVPDYAKKILEQKIKLDIYEIFFK